MENFLNRKFNLTGETAAGSETGKASEQVEKYLNRLEEIVQNPRGFEHLKDRYLRHNLVDISGDKLETLAYKLYQSEKQQAINEGHGANLPD